MYRIGRSSLVARVHRQERAHARYLPLGIAGALAASVLALLVPAQSMAGEERAPAPKAGTSLDPRGFTDPVEEGAAAYALANEIVAAAGYVDFANGTQGYSRADIDPVANRIDLWWKGKLTDEVQALVDGASKRGVTVSVRGAQRTRMEMYRRGQALQQNPRLEREGVFITNFSWPSDASGFLVSIRPAAQRGSKSALAKKLAQEAAGAPVLQVSEEPEAASAVLSLNQAAQNDLAANGIGRQGDYAPWWGGTGIVSTRTNSAGERNYCSTGFSMTRDGGAGPAMLSAAHCDDALPTPQRGWYAANAPGNADRVFARDEDTRLLPTLDSMKMYTVGDTSGCIYTGSNSSSTYLCVKDIVGNFVGERMRVGGANSGEHIFKITAVDQNVACEYNADYGTNYTCSFGVKAISDDGGYVAQGDSGGPVYDHVDGADPRVHARGIIRAIYNTVNCPSSVSLATRGSGIQCGKTMYYTALNPTKNSWGDIEIKTVPYP